MRYAIFKRGGYKQGVIGATGGDLTGRAILSRNPIGNAEASTKNYVDVKFDTLPIANLVSGIIPGARVPEYSGDIVKLEGSSSTTVKTTTVAEGSYPKVTVNIKGQVTAGASLTESDLPVLPWDKIFTGKPTTLAGYGITDALSTSGGTIVGKLKVSEVNVDPDYLVNKSFVDLASEGGVGTSTGCIIYRNQDITPIGFLRCNGAALSKTDYPALYSVVGDKYTSRYLAGNGRPWQWQHEFNSVQSAPLGPQVVTPYLTPEAVYGSLVGVTKNRVIVMGGWDTQNYINRSYSAPLNADGSIGAWVRGPDMPSRFWGGTISVFNNYLYTTPGRVSQSGQTPVIYKVSINADGTLGTFTAHQSFPVNTYIYELIFTNTKVYAFAQQPVGETYQLGYMIANVLETGEIGQFSPLITLNYNYSGIIIIKDRLYLLNYLDVNTGLYYIASCPINTDGTIGTVTVHGPNPCADGLVSPISTKNTLYAFGAWNINSTTTYMYHAPINADGTIGAWTAGNVLNTELWWTSPVVLGNGIYSFGEGDVNGPLRTIYRIPFSGGSNDYSQYYDGAYAALNGNDMFRLPTINPSLINTYAFIKI